MQTCKKTPEVLKQTMSTSLNFLVSQQKEAMSTMLFNKHQALNATSLEDKQAFLAQARAYSELLDWLRKGLRRLSQGF